MAQERITLLQNKRIILAVTGSIAAYKAVDLASKLTQTGALVDVIMTDAAQQFVTPLTFQSVTGRAVYTDLWKSETTGSLPTHVAHIGLGEGADLMMIAPATANIIAKLAGGFADDLVTVTALAARCPIVVAPAMDGGMYTNPGTQENLQTLRRRNIKIIEPEAGRFASGLAGTGRLPDTHTLLGAIRYNVSRASRLHDRKLVVTAGGTREPLDPVRFITNRSSGKQGHALAQAALDAGADVTLITTARHLPPIYGAQMVWVETAQELHDAVLQHTRQADALLMAAAVADFRPQTTSRQKIKKKDDSEEGLRLELVRNPDILMSVKAQREEIGQPRVAVGFAAESEHLQENAVNKLKRKGLDLLIANDISAKDAGFDVDTNRALIIDKGGGEEMLALATKTSISEAIIVRVGDLLLRL